ncbi:MAG: peptidoglycan DD-metalloendopeptidase family protein [Acidimicrobiia bacterium]|nr:peptidoglycan DD-metalloendopeptidase family protein [Acidimicrobiia bacterium]
MRATFSRSSVSRLKVVRRKVLWTLPVVLLLVMSSTSGAQSELDQVRATVSALQDEIDEYLDQMIAIQARADAAGVRYWEADLALYELNVEIVELSQRVAGIDADVAELRRQMIEIAVQRYIDSTTPPSILAGDDINRQAAVDALARFVREGSLDIIDDYRRARDDLDQAQALLAERARHQQELISQAAAAAAEVQAELNAIGSVYLEIAPRLYEQDRLLDGLEEAERRRLEEELRRRQAEEARRVEAARAAAAVAAEAERRAALTAEVAGRIAGEAVAQAAAAAPEAPQVDPGAGALPPVRPGEPGDVAVPVAELPVLQAASGWVCPLAGPFSHFDDFGDPRHYGGWHKGNDLIAPTGTPVLAVESGRVEHRANRIGGNSAYLFADSGNYYYNTHLSAYENVGAGWVPAGAVIGYVGDSGNAAGLPHLHFEYHLGGRGNHINPYPIVHEACF